MTDLLTPDLDAARSRFWRIKVLKVDTGFPERLRDSRILIGLTQVELARRMGCDDSYIQTLEAGGIRLPGPRIVESAAKVLRVHPDWLRGYAIPEDHPAHREAA